MKFTLQKIPSAASSFLYLFIFNFFTCGPSKGVSFVFIYRCQLNSVPICLMYGKEDPWVRPVWGLRVKHQVPDAPYYEISPAGHCPHDEVPEVMPLVLESLSLFLLILASG